jgi:hypothetical protein
VRSETITPHTDGLTETDATMDVDEMHGERSRCRDKATVDKEVLRRIDGHSVARALRDSALSGVSKEAEEIPSKKSTSNSGGLKLEVIQQRVTARRIREMTTIETIENRQGHDTDDSRDKPHKWPPIVNCAERLLWPGQCPRSAQ